MADAAFTPFPTVQPTGAPSDYQRLNVNPEQFGASVGQAQAQAGDTLSGLGNEALKIGVARAEINNELYANDINTEYAKKFEQTYRQYTELEGKNADAGLGSYSDNIQGIYRDAVASAPNLQSKKLLSNSLRLLTDRYIYYGQVHAHQQRSDWERQSALDAADEHANQAMLAAENDDPRGMDLSLQAGMGQQQKLAEQHGLASDESSALQKKWMGQAVSGIVRSSIDLGDIDKAQSILDKYKGQMDTKGILVAENALKPALQDRTSSAAATKATSPTYGPAPAQFADIERAHGLPSGLLAGFYSIESNSGKNLGTGTKFKGPFQVSDEYATEAGIKDPYNLVDAANGVATKAQRDMKEMAPAIGHTPTAGELYLAHNQGTTGAIALLTHPDATAASIVGLDKVQANLPGPFKSEAATIKAGQFAKFWTDHFDGVNATPASTTMVPESTAISRVSEDPEIANNPALLQKTVSKIKTAYSNWRLENKSTIDSLNTNVPDLIRQLESGEGDIDAIASQYPAEAVRNFLPDKAPTWEAEINAAKNIGGLIQNYKWESPEAVDQARADLASGHGPVSEYVAKLAGNDSWMFSRLQTMGTARLVKELNIRQEKLINPGTADPAAYVLSNPGVQAARSKVVQDHPETYEAFAQKSLIVQHDLGVPSVYSHILTKAEAEATVQQITSNSSTAKSQMDLIAKHTGQAWGSVYSDLVTLGKLPSDYQGLMRLQNKVDLDDYSHALQETKKNDFGDWGTALGYGDRSAGIKIKKDIDINVQAGLSPYINSLRQSGVDDAQINDVIKTTSLLAYGHTLFKQDTDAAAHAVHSFIGDYSFLPQGGARVPARIYDVVNTNAQAMLQQIDSAIRIPDNIGRAGQMSKDAYLSWLKGAPEWVTSKDGQSIYLRDPQGNEVLGNDGNRLEVKFSGPKSYSSNFELKVPVTETLKAPIDAYRNSLIQSGRFSEAQVKDMTDTYKTQLTTQMSFPRGGF